MSNKIPYLEIENATIIFKNFSGAETQYNRKGNRNFHVIIDGEENADRLMGEGWNIKKRPPRDGEGDPICTMQVTVRFDILPPQIYLVSERTGKKTLLDEESVELLDYADISNVDLIIRPRAWEVNGKEGIKAYLKTMYVTVREDRFAEKYAEG